jgi:hypothetical protein
MNARTELEGAIMLVLLKSTYPPTAVKKMLEVFTSPDTPKRFAASKEIASFAYGDRDGYHGLIILDVEDDKFAEFARSQTARSAYMQSRVPGLQVDVIPGHSVMDAIGLVAAQVA